MRERCEEAEWDFEALGAGAVVVAWLFTPVVFEADAGGVLVVLWGIDGADEEWEGSKERAVDCTSSEIEFAVGGKGPDFEMLGATGGDADEIEEGGEFATIPMSATFTSEVEEVFDAVDDREGRGGCLNKPIDMAE